MKITITLTEAEVKGIKAYIKETEGKDNPNKQDVQQQIQGEVSALLQAPHSSLADYIKQFS